MTVAQLVKFSNGVTTVYVDSNMVLENMTNKIKVINIPTTDTSPATPGVINLNKVEDRFTITGFLSNGNFSGETHTKAVDKKNALKTMFRGGVVVTMTWEGTDFSVAVDKFESRYSGNGEDPALFDGADTDAQYSASEFIVYDITITMVVAEDLV